MNKRRKYLVPSRRIGKTRALSLAISEAIEIQATERVLRDVRQAKHMVDADIEHMRREHKMLVNRETKKEATMKGGDEEE